MNEAKLPGILIFIRHAVAVDAEQYAGSDGDRPLTRAGIRKASQAFRTLLKVYKPTHIVSSPFVRAAATASILVEQMTRLGQTPAPAIEVTEALLPGASWELWSGFLDMTPGKFDEQDVVCVIGHEPSIGSFFCRHLGLPEAIPFKKAGVGIIAPRSLTQATLIAFAPSKLLRG